LFRVYPTDAEEATGIAAEIAAAGYATWDATAILGRTRAVLGPIQTALRQAGVKAAIATRRDRFMSPQFVWLQACLDQSLRPADRQIFVVLVDAANRMAGTEGNEFLDAALLQARAEASGCSYLEQWGLAAQSSSNSIASQLGALALQLVQSRSAWPKLVEHALRWLPTTVASANGVVSDVMDDKAAWETAARAIRSEKGGGDLDLAELLQGIALRPKEPPQEPNTVILLTVHAAKGLEFEHVWVVGLAHGILPSWQSVKSDAKAAELEEERRNCFVAITRTKKLLVLSRAERYGGYAKAASQFLQEMSDAVG
jgi:DNA helicase-2/ATP-dependent DNA helicase PcrA